MLKNYCLLILALCVVNIYCKGIQPADEQAPKNDKKVVGSNEEFGPSRAAHEAMFGKDVDDYPRTTIIEESIVINSMPFDQVTVHPSTKATQTTPEKDEAEENAVIKKGEKLTAAADDNSGVCLEIEVEHMHGDKVVNKGKGEQEDFPNEKETEAQEEKATNENSKSSLAGEDKKETNVSGMFDFLWALFGMTPSKKEVDEKNKEIVGDATSSKEEEKSEEENTTNVPPKQTEVEKVVSKIVKTDTAPTEAVEEKKSEIKVIEQKKNKDEKKEGEKKHKKKADKTTPKIEIPTADKRQKQGLNKDHSEDYSKFSDELMKSDIIDSEESSESSSSEENEKDNEKGEKKGDEKKAHHHGHHEEPKSGFIHFGLVKTLALVTAGPALIIAVVVLLSRAHMKKRDSTMM